MPLDPIHSSFDDLEQFRAEFPYRPTLFLGLGGTGAQSVAKIKRLFLDLYAPDAQAATDAVIQPIPSMYRFLAFDSDAGNRPPELANRREWFHIGVHDLDAFYKQSHKDPFFKDWLPTDFSVGAIASGCQGLRGLGRFALMYNLATVRDELQRAMANIMQADPRLRNTTPVIYLCGSLSGGTGAGIFLDVAFLLRHIDQNARITGLISVMDGIGGMPQIQRETMQIGTYCALKELNAFMTPHHEAIKYGSIEYPMGVHGECTQPFDTCYLISNYRNDGTRSLTTHPAFSSFTARVAFSMSAYAFNTATTPDFEGVLNDHLHYLQVPLRNYKVPFLVPGFAQVHFPVKDAALLFALQAVREYVKYQCSGQGTEGTEQAMEFLTRNALQPLEVLAKVSKDVHSRKSLVARTHDEKLKELFEDPYKNAEEILGMPKAYPTEREKELRSRVAPNVKEAVSAFTVAMVAEVNQQMMTEGRLGVGAMDFMDDLVAVLDLEHAKVASANIKKLRPALDAIAMDWRAMDETVTNAVTDNGMIDRGRDWLKRSANQVQLTAFLNAAEATLVDWVVAEVWREALGEMLRVARDHGQALADLFRRDLPDAKKLFDERYTELVTKLENQARGKGDDVMGICSINAMSDTWLKEYFTHQVGLAPASAMATLVQQGWHPSQLLAVVPPVNGTRPKALADSLIDHFRPLASAVEALGPIDILTAKTSAKDVAATASATFFSQLQPQMQVGLMRTFVQYDPHHLLATGGITPALKAKMEQMDEFQDIPMTIANNLEPNRINFLKVSLPVGLVGCSLVKNNLEKIYKRWHAGLIKGSSKEAERQRNSAVRKFHCFPGSFNWPLPTEVIAREYEELSAFAKLLAISEMLKPDESDFELMKKFAKKREVAYAIQQLGQTHFWIWPFFEPYSKRTDLVGVPESLGSNVYEALKAYECSEPHRGIGARWIQWIEDNWIENWPVKEFESRKDAALKTFSDRKAKTTDPDQKGLWDELSKALKAWQI